MGGVGCPTAHRVFPQNPCTVEPSFDLAEAQFILSFGVGLLEAWLGPVHASQAFARLRRSADRPRGLFIQVDPRRSSTAIKADRLQKARERARVENRAIKSGEYVPACAEVCPAQAIVFGDLLDPGSEVSKLARSPRAFKLHEELGTKPKVIYLIEGEVSG